MAQIPKREAIFDALATQLGAHRARNDVDQRDLPARVLWSGEDAQVERDRYGSVAVTTGASLIAQHPADVDRDQWDTQGNAVMAALIADATSGDRSLGGLAEDVTYTASAILYPDDGSAILTVGVDLAIRWRHPVGDPYIEQP